MYNADDYYPEAIYLWKDTYAFREWFKKGDEPGGGINYRDIETPDATTEKEIKTCCVQKFANSHRAGHATSSRSRST